MGGAVTVIPLVLEKKKRRKTLSLHDRSMAKAMLADGYSEQSVAEFFKIFPADLKLALKPAYLQPRLRAGNKSQYKENHSKGEPAKMLPDISLFNARVKQAIEVLGEERAFKGIIGKEEVYYLDGNRVPYTRLIEAAGLTKGRAWV